MQLWLRPIDSLTAQPLSGTDGASYPFWSPDSRFIAYSMSGKLMKIDVSGGPPQTLCAFSGGATILGRSGTWNRDGVIVFNNGPNLPLYRVSSAGGTPVAAWPLPAGQVGQGFPSFLPDGHHVLLRADATTEDASGVYVASLDTGETQRILGADTGAIYSAHDGSLLFVRQGTLLRQRFDQKTFALVSEPFAVAEQVESGVVPGVIAFSVSETGIPSYGVGSGPAVGLQMTWVDRQGKRLQAVGPQANYQGVMLSPDGTRVAAHRHDLRGGDIWVTDLTRGTTSRLTFDPSQDNASPVWSPDGFEIVFTSRRGGKFGFYRKAADNTGAEERLFESDLPKRPTSWAPAGRSIAFSVLDPTTGQDLWRLPLSGDRRPVVWLQTPFNENEGKISPDGKWLNVGGGHPHSNYAVSVDGQRFLVARSIARDTDSGPEPIVVGDQLGRGAEEVASPEPGDAVGVERRLVADEREILELSLGDQHAVEWIAMAPRKAAGALRMQDGDVERRKSLSRHRSDDVRGHSAGTRQLAKAGLGRDLPRRRRADEDGIALVGDRGPASTMRSSSGGGAYAGSPRILSGWRRRYFFDDLAAGFDVLMIEPAALGVLASVTLVACLWPSLST